MTPTKAEQVVRQACIAANPDLMAPSDVKEGTLLRHYEGWETVALGVVDEHNGVIHKNGYGPIKTFNIIGRSIRLADVLLALTKVKPVPKMVLWSIEVEITPHNGDRFGNCMWNLLKDNLSDQSDETKLFLAELLSN